LKSWNDGLEGLLDPDTFKNVIKAAELYTRLGREEMKPLVMSKHEIDIKQETIRNA
jgi:hypothetical protein